MEVRGNGTLTTRAQLVGWNRATDPPEYPHIVAFAGRGRIWTVWQNEELDWQPENALRLGWEAILWGSDRKLVASYEIHPEPGWQPGASFAPTRRALTVLMGTDSARAVVKLLPALLRERYSPETLGEPPKEERADVVDLLEWLEKS